jgi:hypothetical protein
MLYIVLAIILTVILIVVVISCSDKSGTDNGRDRRGRDGYCDTEYLPEYKLAGNQGEKVASRAIASVLREDDNLLTNVNVEFEGKEAEMDNVVVNRFGVFIIEVKNYSGEIHGREDEFEWQKYKVTDAGKIYWKPVRNPIKQVKRQIDILARYLRAHDVRVWIKGYVILLQGNSPVENEYVLQDIDDIDRVIHTKDRNYLSSDVIVKIVRALE